jgi:hypothetical protein
MSEPTVLLVLHALRLRSFAPVDEVAGRYGLETDEVDLLLKECERSGWATYRSGRMTGWSLSAEGRREGERLLAAELDAAGARPAVESGYEAFLGLNGELLSVCTDWQVVEVDGESVLNDHTDTRRDESVLTRLDDLHDRAVPVAEGLAAALERFGGYGDRLTTARARVRAGDTDWLTKPMIDSYHTVWFELHEDLLATLGRERSQERP